MAQRLKIVYLEDCLIYQEAVVHLLDPEKQKYFIQAFQYPSDALRYIENSLDANAPVDLIITDFSQKSDNGYLFASRIRTLELKYNKYIPILLLSLLEPDRRVFIPLGLEDGLFNRYLPKNADSEQIINAVSELITGHKT